MHRVAPRRFVSASHAVYRRQPPLATALPRTPSCRRTRAWQEAIERHWIPAFAGMMEKAARRADHVEGQAPSCPGGVLAWPDGRHGGRPSNSDADSRDSEDLRD